MPDKDKYTQQDYIDSYLNDLERIQLQKFVDDEAMSSVVKKVLLGGIYQNGTLKKGADPKSEINCAFSYLNYADGRGVEVSNELVGANIRALLAGIKAVKFAFEAIEDYKTPEEPGETKKNQAR